MGIRNYGDCPCPRCLVNKWDISKIGQALDFQSRASNACFYVGEKIRDTRNFIFKLGYNVASAAVEHLLSMHSWVATLVGSARNLIWTICSPFLKNIFAEKLGKFSFNPYQMLIVDLMHEFELDVWKAVFTHLICILYAAGSSGSLVSELDKRYMFAIFPTEKYLTSTYRFHQVPTLVWIQFRNLPIMHLKWKKWQLEISKISYRYLSYISKILGISS